MLAKGSLRSAVNRFYHAAFYVVVAYLIALEEETSTHKGVKSKFNLHLAATNAIDRETARSFNELFALRNELDYIDFSTITEDEVDEINVTVTKVRATIKKLLEAF